MVAGGYCGIITPAAQWNWREARREVEEVVERFFQGARREGEEVAAGELGVCVFVCDAYLRVCGQDWRAQGKPLENTAIS
jgi:hypothetical protein